MPATGTSSYVLDLTFDSEGAKSFDSAVAELYSRLESPGATGQLALVVNGLVIWAPVAQPGLGSSVAVNGLDPHVATALASLIRQNPSAVLFRPVLAFSRIP